MSERKKLILIDGHGLAYRQFHGLPMDKFTTMSGEPTNATWGFARSLLDILQAPTPPHYLAVVFDQGLSGREVVYTEYKANREEMADSLSVQIARIRELVQTFNIPILEKDGYEADDVIGSVVQKAVAEGAEVLIVTGDRDLMQLVEDHVTLELPTPPAQARHAGPSQFYDVARVLERFGVRPDQYVDYKGFVGDPSDNIPGVKGIGEKTATALLQKYGTMEGIYEHLDEIKGSQHDKLEQGREKAFLSRDLSRIMIDIPLAFDLEKCTIHNYDAQAVADLFKILEFRSLTNRLGLPKTESAPVAASGQMSLFDEPAPAAPEEIKQVVNTIVVDTPESLADLVSILEAAQNISFDTETTGTDQMRADIVGISLAVNGDTGYYIPVGHVAPDGMGEPPRQLPIETVIEALRPAMTDPQKPKWAQNAVYDLIILRRYGLDVTPITFDTMVAEFLVNSDARRGLKDQAEYRLGVSMTHIDELIGRGKGQITMDRVPIERAAPYAAADAAITYRLVEPLERDLKKPLPGSKNKLWELLNEVEMPLVPVIGDLDMTGAKIDQAYLRDLSKEFNERLNVIAEQIYEQAGEVFKIGSLKQLNDILFTKLGFPTKGLSKTVHGYSIDSDALESLEQPDRPIIRSIIEWRTLEKLRSTYVDALQSLVDSQGRIHTSYNQTGAVTGRVSSDSPNLQNIPIRTEEGQRVRRAFIAPPGCHLLSVDYSQIELRILASFSGDTFLREAFVHDQDVHRATAAAVFNIPFEAVNKEQRYLAKRVNFGLMYGMGAHRLARESGLTMAESQAFIERYFQRFPDVKQYFDGSKKRAEQQGYLETLLGRRRYFPLLQLGASTRGAGVQRARAEREAINMPVQGTAADIMKLAMIEVSARLKAEQPNARLILQVHDELVMEVPENEVVETAALVRHVMENVIQLEAVPLRADAQSGINWTEMHPVEG